MLVRSAFVAPQFALPPLITREPYRVAKGSSVFATHRPEDRTEFP